ncbi:MAG: hypothetical protein K9J21_10880 [Bacteroidales bacterium]|nr:hypothetical protein [Bacteroidales bacterium]
MKNISIILSVFVFMLISCDREPIDQVDQNSYRTISSLDKSVVHLPENEGILHNSGDPIDYKQPEVDFNKISPGQIITGKNWRVWVDPRLVEQEITFTGNKMSFQNPEYQGEWVKYQEDKVIHAQKSHPDDDPDCGKVYVTNKEKQKIYYIGLYVVE